MIYSYTTAQTNVYHPFPNIYGDWWIRTYNYPNNSPGPFTDDLYYTTGTTIINSLTYMTVSHIYKGTILGPIPPLNYIFTGGTYDFAYRNDSINKKVYILLADSSNETLWYDFNLNKGDTIKNVYAIQNMPSYFPSSALIVQAIDSVLNCDVYYKSYSCACPCDTTNVQHLIEGSGFDSNFINFYTGGLCTWEPSQVWSTSSWSLDECPNDLGIKNNHTQKGINIYPNPAQNNFTIETSTNEKQTINVFDVNGNLILSQTITSTTNVDASNLISGVYNINITNSVGVVNKRLVIVK